MAELVGFISSVLGIAAVATCLVETVLKIQALCREVKNAPKELTLVVNEIHHSGTILKAVAESYAAQSNISRVHMRSGLLKESMSLCQNALTSISSLATELQDNVTRRRRRSGFQIVLKQKVMRDMLERLHRSKTDLHFAYSIWTDEHRRIELERISQNIDRTRCDQTRLLEYSQRDRESNHDQQVDAESTEDNQASTHSDDWAISIRFQTPSQIGRYRCEIALRKAAGLFTTSLQTTKAIPSELEVWQMCCKGDIDNIVALFNPSKLASHGHNQMGLNLVQVSCSHDPIYASATNIT